MMMKPLAILLLSAAFIGPAFAENVFIRVEAKRGNEAAAEAAAAWQGRVNDIPAVIFPLSQTWTAIGFGPLPREQAEARMTALKEARTIPADSLLTPADGVNATALPNIRADQTGAASIVENPAGAASTSGVAEVAQPDPIIVEPPAPDMFIRLEAFQDRTQADAALSKWRETVPEAGLWEMPNGWFAIAAGPLSGAAADQWLPALKNGGAIPDDSMITPEAEMGRNVATGTAPEWPENPEKLPEMPDTAEVQELLQWAGFYDGEIDGQSGPKTRAAIAAEVASQREAADPALALMKLAEQREVWRQEMGLEEMIDDHTGLSLVAPARMLQHERNDRSLSIYGPKDESGAALILFSAPGGQQEMEDLAGLVTALGWVPAPERQIRKGSAVLTGRNDSHIGRSESRIVDGRVEGWVLIWPVADAENAPRLANEIAESFTRAQPSAAERAAAEPSDDAAEAIDGGAETPAALPDGATQTPN
ncbi:peptidoglycan-binding domain-containing protein [Paracoccus albus]|uniref:peptidoglycan-binding domain-containing protein n=1 Tax=Paracoccus albus TaxID=3017784 RepID=UPI0022F0E314|nr:peptidoglycan-binding domain-containing protein [Paracoccus albus]WBU61484.1 peptidoglycan-binding domain-containing protein [Paracoccus albus]